MPLEAHVQRLRVVALPAACLAFHIDVGQELHLDLADAVALAGFAASTLDVEAEASRRIAPDLGIVGGGENLAYDVEKPRVSGWIRARCAPNGALVDDNHLIDELDSVDGLVLAWRVCLELHTLQDGAHENAVDQRGFARAGNACDAAECA